MKNVTRKKKEKEVLQITFNPSARELKLGQEFFKPNIFTKVKIKEKTYPLKTEKGYYNVSESKVVVGKHPFLGNITKPLKELTEEKIDFEIIQDNSILITTETIYAKDFSVYKDKSVVNLNDYYLEYEGKFYQLCKKTSTLSFKEAWFFNYHTEVLGNKVITPLNLYDIYEKGEKFDLILKAEVKDTSLVVESDLAKKLKPN